MCLFDKIRAGTVVRSEMSLADIPEINDTTEETIHKH